MNLQALTTLELDEALDFDPTLQLTSTTSPNMRSLKLAISKNLDDLRIPLLEGFFAISGLFVVDIDAKLFTSNPGLGPQLESLFLNRVLPEAEPRWFGTSGQVCLVRL